MAGRRLSPRTYLLDMASSKKKKLNGLTSAEQKTTAAFKLLSHENKILKQSLKKTQDELEQLRSKYHEADKANSILTQRIKTAPISELIKFFTSTFGGGFAISYFFSDHPARALVCFIGTVVVYAVTVILSNK